MLITLQYLKANLIFSCSDINLNFIKLKSFIGYTFDHLYSFLNIFFVVYLFSLVNEYQLEIFNCVNPWFTRYLNFFSLFHS